MLIPLLTLTFVLLVILFLSISFYITIFGGGPFVPTPYPAVEAVLKEAKINKGEKLIDIGAGDGRFLHFAETKYGAKARGFELDPFVYFLSKLRQTFWGWKGKVTQGNFLNQKISDADIVICYMLPKTLERFQPKFDKELKAGTRVISYAFHIGDWKPKKIVPKNGKISQIFVYEISKSKPKNSKRSSTSAKTTKSPLKQNKNGRKNSPKRP